VNYFVDPFPTVSNAGNDSTICFPVSSLNGNSPAIGTGMWTVITGGATITNPSSANTAVTGITTGLNIFRWTISNGTCLASVDEVIINLDEEPSIANAGEDHTTHLTYANINAEIPLTGSGTWILISGSGTFDNINNPSTKVSGLSKGENVFRWTISNGTCNSNSDEVSVFVTEIFVPSGFSPNGDNVNDNFEIPGIEEFNGPALSVFNRWGNLVYSNREYRNEWNGNTNNGEELSDDTYYYTLEIGDETSIKGYVIIKRK
jgi:gliding motility-associated-like protein